MVPELFILRHGETEWNRAGRFQGWRDSPLTAEGAAQARAMGELLAARGIGPQSHAVRVSPSGRTLATAALAFPGAPHVTDANLREIDMGGWAGRTRAELAAEGAVAADLPMLEFYAAVPGGEGFGGLWDRAGAALAALTGPAILVTHGVTSRFLRARAIGLPIDRLGELDGGQGVIFHVRDGRIARLEPGAP